MGLTVITPLHAPGVPFISHTHLSLLGQTLHDWEWLILTNNGGVVPDDVLADPRVRVIAAEPGIDKIGALKRALSLQACGDFIVELDADDLLAPEALSMVAQAFEGGADFVYSDCAEFKDGTWDAKWERYPYGERYGWSHYPAIFGGHELLAMHTPPATPHNLRLVEWSPNHVRAWRRQAYIDVGGHDETMAVGDDHDLIVRMFLAGKRFVHIPRCLYFYRVHEKNTVATKNAAIRDATWGVYNRNIWKLAEKWARDADLNLVDLCGGVDCPAGYLAVDRRIAAGTVGIACDLDGLWPFDDSSVGVLRASDAVEHLRDPIHTMNEAFRVLAPGGWLMIDVPSTNGLGAFCDPTHVSFWNRLSFRYYTDKNFARYVPAFRGKFQIARCIEWFPSSWHRENNVPYIQAHLIALKPCYAPMGEVLW